MPQRLTVSTTEKVVCAKSQCVHALDKSNTIYNLVVSPMNTNLVSHTLPTDWDSPESPFHGVSKSSRLRGYVVSLLLNHRQYQFGPFRTSQLEAANAYDALMKYFLAFTKGKPQPNCPAESFFKLTEEDAENVGGAERIQKLRAKFQEEYKAAGLDYETELAFRADYILTKCHLHSNRVISHADRRRRRALVQLEAMHLRGFKRTPLIVENLRLLCLTKEQRNAIEEVVASTLRSHNQFNASLETLIRDVKASLGLNPNASTPSELQPNPTNE